MFNHTIRFAGLTAVSFLMVLAVSGGDWLVAQHRACGEEPAKPEGKGDRQQQLATERLAVVREIAKLSTEAYKAGAGSYDEVAEARRMMLQAELETCDSAKERITVLEKVVAEAKKTEELAAHFSAARQASARTALKAKADRLHAEIALEKAKAEAAGQTGVQLDEKTALAEKQVAIKQAAVKAAEAKKQMVLAKLASLKGQVAEAQASESFAEKQFERVEAMLKQHAVSTEQVDESRALGDAAKARRAAAEGSVAECEAQLLLEAAHVEMAHLEVDKAELCLRTLRSKRDSFR